MAGLALPELAVALRPWLPATIGLLLALTALRIGPRAAFGSLSDMRRTAATLLVLQLALPLAAVAVAWALGTQGAAAVLAVTLTLAAPSVTGSPNFAILLGHPPAPALRLLVMGTALFPATVLPVLWLSPAFEGAGGALLAVGRLLAVIAASVAAGFAIRARFLRRPGAEATAAIDGLAVVLLAVIVIGLMSAVRPALLGEPAAVAGWLALACALNLGMQVAAALVLPSSPERGAVSVVAGNRNVALFLIALPAEVTDPLLIFVGCYQIPMYLTPILLRPLHARLLAEGWPSR